jgi:hypothetical protein
MGRHMRHCTKVFAASALLMVFVTSCVKRPAIYIDPSLNKEALIKGGIGFVLPARVTLDAMLQEYATAFSGKVSAGEAATLEAIRIGLCEGFSSFEPPVRIIDMAQSIDTTGMSVAIKWDVDQYGLRSLRVIDPGLLKAMSERAGIEFLLLITDLSILRGKASSTSIGQSVPGTPIVLVSPAEYEYVALGGHAFLWSASAGGVQWNGFINGRHAVGSNLARDTIRGMGAAFAADAEAGLFWALPSGGAYIRPKPKDR